MRNYKSEYAAYHSKPDQIANRSSRNKARRKMVAAGQEKAAHLVLQTHGRNEEEIDQREDAQRSK